MLILIISLNEETKMTLQEKLKGMQERQKAWNVVMESKNTHSSRNFQNEKKFSRESLSIKQKFVEAVKNFEEKFSNVNWLSRLI